MKSLMLISFLSLFVSGLREQFCTANVETAAGTHKVLSRRADAAHSTRYLLVKQGTDALHAAVAGAGDYPIGSTSDTPAAAEDLLNVNPLSNSEYTRQLRATTALAAGVDVYGAANGFVTALPSVAGTYYKVGQTVAAAVQEASSLYAVEVAPSAPVKTLVIATATGTAATDIAALFTALQSGPAVVKSL